MGAQNQQAQERSIFSTGMIARGVGAFLLLSAVAPGPSAVGQAGLSFEDRVEAHRAVEEVLWRHRLWQNPGPRPPLSAVLGERTLRENVREVLRKSNALETLWKQPLTSEQLQAEINRMLAESRDPQMLREMIDALHGDPSLVAEVIARPILADRLLRSSYEREERFHGALRRRAEAALAGDPGVEALRSGSDRYDEQVLILEDSESAASDRPDHGARLLDRRHWDELVLWLGDRLEPAAIDASARVTRPIDSIFASLPVGRPSDPAEDDQGLSVHILLEKAPGFLRLGVASWNKVPFDDWWAQARLAAPAAIDTVVGPFVLPESGPLPPSCPNDSWGPTGGPPATTPPSPRWSFSTVWTGAEVIVWGGEALGGSSTNTGGRYSPATDSWTPTTTSGAPSPRSDHSGIWTGTEMIVWGGTENPQGPYSTGGRYNPAGNSWTPTGLISEPEVRSAHTAVWSGTLMLVWGGWGGSGQATALASGRRYDPATDTWSAMSGVGLAGRYLHSAVWTGMEMIVWGGRYFAGPTDPFGDGGRYNPASDTWGLIGGGGLAPRLGHSAVWDGVRMIIWGGDNNHGTVYGDGARYSPSSNNWIPVPAASAPAARTGHSAVWTGNEMIVWGGWLGAGMPYTATGGRYRPDIGTWIATNALDAPAARYSHDGVWASTRMIVWGGVTGGTTDTGGVYCGCRSWYADLDGDGSGDSTGAQTTTCDGTTPSGFAPVSGDCDDFDPFVHPGAFDGNCNGIDEDCDTVADDDYLPIFHSCGLGVCLRYGFITCGAGQISDSCAPGPPEEGSDLTCNGRDGDCDGGVDEDFAPTEDHWTALSQSPAAVSGAPAVWSGSELLVWSGGQGGNFLEYGQRYAPSTNSWDVFDDPLGLTPRQGHTAVWTGQTMIVWGGDDTLQRFGDGGEFEPVSGGWYPVDTNSAPSPRSGHTAVWTDSAMIVWGGDDGATFLRSGAIYDPSTPAWFATRLTGAPTARAGHTAVWTGSQMIVWGGRGGSLGSPTPLATGSRYDPATNGWGSTSTTGAPAARSGHTAIWTGSEMIIWGGAGASGPLADGARYYPATNAWTSFSGNGAPAARSGHTAIWTGSEMIVWGGVGASGPLADGARYDPVADAWIPMTRAAAPGPRDGAAAVWTGSEMLLWGGENGSALDTGGRYSTLTFCGVGPCGAIGHTFCSGGTAGFACTPGAPSPEICDGLDNDCNGFADDNVPVPGSGPTVKSTWNPSSGLTLDWNPMVNANIYDVVLGSIPILRSTGGNFSISTYGCIADNIPFTTINLGTLPIGIGDGLWFLVRGVNYCAGKGTYDGPSPPQVGSRDLEIQQSGLDCP